MNQNPVKKFDWGTAYCWIFAIVGWASSQPLIRRLLGLALAVGLFRFGVWRLSLDNMNRDAMTGSASSFSTWWLGWAAITCSMFLVFFSGILPIHRARSNRQVRMERERVNAR